MPSSPHTTTDANPALAAAEQVAQAAQAPPQREGDHDPGQHTPGQGGPQESVQVAELRREAATWRKRLRETEQERDSLRARVDAVDRSEVEAALVERMTNPADFWLVAELATAKWKPSA